MTTTEGKFEQGGYSLYTKTWTPEGTIKAKLVFVHGFSEHINRYDDFFAAFSAQGIQVLSWDQRGWGRSVTKPTEKGLTGPTPEVIADVAAFVKEKLAEGEGDKVPLFVMGHSMGGGEILTLAGDAQYRELVSQVRGWILEAPLIGFPEEPSSVKVFMGRLVGKLLPKQQLKHVVPADQLSRDPAIAPSVIADELCHDTGTLEGLAGLLDRTAGLTGGQVRMGKHVQSVFLAHGKADSVCSFDKAMKWLDEQEGLADKTGKPYEGAYHQLHADLCKEEFTGDVVKWILERCEREAAVEAKL